MKKRGLKLGFAFLCLFFAASAGAAENDMQRILRELESLKQTVKAQQAHIEKLENAIEGQKSQSTTADKKMMVPEKKVGVTLANKMVDQLKIKSDLRARYELRDRDRVSASDDTRNRLRTRFRIGGVWTNSSENLEVGAGLATGGLDATSTNDTWSESSEFETGDIRLDYAYAKHKAGDLSLIVGQHKNPFKTSWLFWDSDVRPAGLTLQYKNEAGYFITGGGYGLRFYDSDGDDTAILGAAQVGFENKVNSLSYLAALGYQHHDGLTNDNEAPNTNYEFQIADLYLKLDFPVGDIKLSPYGHTWMNFGADGNAGTGLVGGTLEPDEENIGFVAGVEAKIKQFKAGYAYAIVGADSLYGALKDADFGTGLSETDLKGHRISLGYNFTKNISTSVTAMFYEAAERPNEDEVNLYQVDMKYKF